MSDLVLVDTSVWAEHINHSDAHLHRLLLGDRVLMHPYVTGELAMGNLKRRTKVLSDLHSLPMAIIASEAEVLDFIANRTLFGRGISYIDAHLLASARLMSDVKLWTRDRRLREAAEELQLDFKLPKIM